MDFVNIGVLYKKMGELDLAMDYYSRARAIFKTTGKERSMFGAQLSHNIGVCLTDQKNYPAAIRELRAALDIRRTLLSPNDRRIVKNLWVLAQVYHDWQRYDRAIDVLQEARRLMITDTQSSWEEQIDVYSLLGRCHFQQQQLSKAQAYFETAQKVVFTDPQAVWESTNGRKRALWADLLRLTADVSHARYQSDAQLVHLQRAHEAYRQALELYRSARRQLRGTASNRSWLEQNYRHFDQAINNNLALARLQSPLPHWEEAFRWAEQCRALALRDAFQESQAEYFAQLPADLLQREHHLQSQLAKTEEAIFLAEEASAPDSVLLPLRAQLFDEQMALDSLIRHFEVTYPTYHQLKYDPPPLDLGQLQGQLSQDQALLQYFVGEDQLVVFLIRPHDFQVYQYPLDFPLADWVGEWRRAIHDFAADQEREKAREQYDRLALLLYKKLLAPLAPQLPERLIIVADGVLAYLPFEALLTAAPAYSGRFRQYDFLLRRHSISYAFSSTSWSQQRGHRPNAAEESGVLAVAPSFGSEEVSWSERAEGLGALRFNRQEAEGLVARWGGKLLLGEDASETQFKKHAGRYAILHLATHAKANDRVGDFSYLAFGQATDSLDNATLYARELYALPLRADLVVLSACETGIGELQKGEGVISLARGFSYAGAQSILTTLWRVSDDKAYRLMTDFYEALSQGQDKATALRNCKLNYLSNCRDREAHPFYWAAFVGMGNMAALNLGVPRPWWRGWGLGGLLVLGVMGLGWFSNRP